MAVDCSFLFLKTSSGIFKNMGFAGLASANIKCWSVCVSARATMWLHTRGRVLGYMFVLMC